MFNDVTSALRRLESPNAQVIFQQRVQDSNKEKHQRSTLLEHDAGVGESFVIAGFPAQRSSSRE